MRKTRLPAIPRSAGAYDERTSDAFDISADPRRVARGAEQVDIAVGSTTIDLSAVRNARRRRAAHARRRVAPDRAEFRLNGRAEVGLLDPQPLHPVAHRAERDAEQLRRGRAVEARLLERLVDRRALDAVEIILQRPLVAGGHRELGIVGHRRQVQVVGGDLLRVGGQREAALEDVLELAHVARERIALERRDRLGVELRGLPRESRARIAWAISGMSSRISRRLGIASSITCRR